MRRKIQVLGWTLIWSAVFIFSYLGWQLFGTDLINAGVQAQAEETLVVSLPQRAPEATEEIDVTEYLGEETSDQPQPAAIEFHPEEAPELGEELAFLRIPEIGLEAVVFEGVDTETLRKGPGHMPGTPIPGQPGNAVISGHRTTYGRPFFDLDQLETGDRIELETAIGTHVYEVREVRIVLPTDVWVIDPRPGGWITLTTCNPKFSARERLILWAEMVSGPNIDFIELHKQRFG